MKYFNFILLLILSTSLLFSQLLNNGQSVNSPKAKITNKFLNTEVFSFPIKKQNIPNILKVTYQEYTKDSLIYTYKTTEELTPDLKDAYLRVDRKGMELKIFIFETTDTSFIINLDANGINFKTIISGHKGAYKYLQYKGYQPAIGKKTVMFIRYAIENSKEITKCNDNTPLEIINKLYSYVIAAIVEIE